MDEGLLLFMTRIKRASRGRRLSAGMTKVKKNVSSFAAGGFIRHIVVAEDVYESCGLVV